ncbi:putative lipoprotein [Klebsiella sp. OBRC7]|nr:putative lipoprotein [Klebsiella sp. OBRC7]
MRLTVRLLMRIYQGASLSWHWSAGVLATVVFGSCCAVKGFMLIISACTGFITSVA